MLTIILTIMVIIMAVTLAIIMAVTLDIMIIAGYGLYYYYLDLDVGSVSSNNNFII